jgi:hypothetical protein
MQWAPGLSDDYRVHPALAEALDLVLGDVRRTTEIDPIVTDEGFDDDPDFYTSSALLSCGSGQRGVYVQNGASLAERLVKVADIVQDEVTDAIWGAWPLCPEHRNHYLAVTVQDEVAVWL